MLPLMIAGECTALFASHAVDQLTASRTGIRRWLNILAQSLGWSSFLVTLFAIFWWSISGRGLAPVEIARLGLAILATISVLLVVVAILGEHARRRKQIYDAWRTLDLDA